MATFTSSVAGKDEGPFRTYAEAFANFFPRVTAMVSRGTSYQLLETACWIEGDFGPRRIPLMFCDARDLAYDLGVLVGDGELQDPTPDVDPMDVEIAFLKSMTAVLEAGKEATQRLYAEAASAAVETAVAVVEVANEDHILIRRFWS